MPALSSIVAVTVAALAAKQIVGNQN
jgi:hypothetical protein